MNESNNYIIDNRTAKDVQDKILRLAKSYTPEWNPDMSDPDAGATLGMIYADQIAENLQRVDHIVGRYHTEFVNLLDISVRPAKPAQSVVVMNLAQDTIEGSLVSKGTKLLSGDIVFETDDTVYVSSVNIPFIFMTRGDNGSIITIKKPEEEYEGENRDSFTLFGESDGVERNALHITHSSVLDGTNDDIFIRFEGADSLVDSIASGKRQFCILMDGQYVPVKKTELMEDGITFRISTDIEKIENDDADGISEPGVLALVDRGAVLKDEYAEKLYISAKGDKKTPEYVGNPITEFQADSFEPFTDTIAMYSECYIGCPDYFAKADSVIEISFDLSFERNNVKLTAEEEEAELKIIKRKPRSVPANVPADVYADIVSIEYYNGVGWKKLETSQDLRFIFSDDRNKTVNMSFICPKDWEESPIGGYSGRAIRFMVTKSDNCYIRPSVHHYPHISNLTVDFSYENMYVKPEKLVSLYGTRTEDITDRLLGSEKLPILRTTGYKEDALYLALSKKPVTGPVSLFVKLTENKCYEQVPCIWQYSSRDGFKHLKIIDGTDNFSKSGTIMFQPPADMYEADYEGRTACYLRVIRAGRATEDVGVNYPIVEQITFNGIRVKNVDTREELDFFIDEVRPGCTFSLNNRDIYEARVWVNEIDVLSYYTMKDMLKNTPDIVKAEYDMQGKISAFFVLYKEVERLDGSDDRRVYELDRLSGELIFGNGIHTEIPRCTSGVALKVGITTCNGALGNVDEGSINTPMSNMLYVGDFYNPIKAYGGTNIESVEAAMIRGANLISGRRRLVSRQDYINEIMSYSDIIDQVSCIPGYDMHRKKKDSDLTFIVLLKDFMDGSYSYHKLKDDLKSHLLKRCEITVGEDELNIIEPVFVDISIMAWVKAEAIEDSFEVQSNIIENLNEFLSPLSGGNGGWKIGSLPTVSQLQMKLGFFKKNATIRNMAVIAEYTDETGHHEMDLNNVKVTPFMVARPGHHEIHVEL